MAKRRPARRRSAIRPHRYDEYCPVSRALELVGDRWSLLLVVELLFMPKRYSDLLQALNGIGTNLLAARLKRLEQGGVVRKRRLPPPAASTVYELTERGRLLEPVAFALGRFGLHYLEPPEKGLSLPLETWLFGLLLTFKPEVAGRVDETYELRIDGRPAVHVRVREGRMAAAPGEAAAPDVVIVTATPVLLALSMRRLSPSRALAGGDVKLEGDRSAFRRFVSMFEMPVPEGDAAPARRRLRKAR